MNEDKPIIITPEEAEACFPEGDYIHNFADGGMIMLGCDYDRADAIKALKDAVQIEIGGPGCKSMRHPIVVWSNETRYTFFVADMEKIDALEASKAEGRA